MTWRQAKQQHYKQFLQAKTTFHWDSRLLKKKLKVLLRKDCTLTGCPCQRCIQVETTRFSPLGFQTSPIHLFLAFKVTTPNTLIFNQSAPVQTAKAFVFNQSAPVQIIKAIVFNQSDPVQIAKAVVFNQSAPVPVTKVVVYMEDNWATTHLTAHTARLALPGLSQAFQPLEVNSLLKFSIGGGGALCILHWSIMKESFTSVLHITRTSPCRVRCKALKNES